MSWEIEVDIYTLVILMIKQITRTYCTAQGTLFSAPWSPKGKEIQKGGRYIYTRLADSLCCIAEMNTTLQGN